MPSAADRFDLGPPRDAGAIRSFGLALLIHAALIAALTWGVNWKRTDKTTAFEAELWSSVSQEAAPKLVDPPPPPPLPPSPSPPAPAPQPEPKVQETPSPAPVAKVDIALEQEKKRKLLAEQAQAEKERKTKQEQAKKELAKQEQLKQDQAKRKAAEDLKQAEAKKQTLKVQATAQEQEAQRQKNIARAMGLAGATGGESAKGTAQKSSGPSGPSSSYAGKVKARVKPNIVFTEDIAGNPTAEVEVRTALDGTIMSQRLVKSSGNKAWDDAVVKAIIRTETMPRDMDGRVPTPMILEFRPKD